MPGGLHIDESGFGDAALHVVVRGGESVDDAHFPRSTCSPSCYKGRLHCFVTGPLFLAGAVATALDALDVTNLGGGLIAGTATGVDR